MTQRDRLQSGRAASESGSRGFSLIEVLVTLLIISLALLGAVGMQAYAMRQNQSGEFRSLAVLLVADLAERMEANKAGAVAGSYVVPEGNAAGGVDMTCGLQACDATALAAYDISQWTRHVATTLPGSSWSVTQTITGNPTTYEIRVGWVDRRAQTEYAAHDSAQGVGADQAGRGERFFYTAVRTLRAE